MFTATDNVAVTGYLLTETATAPVSGAGGWTLAAPTSYIFAGIPDGIATVKSLYAWAKDAAGNVSLSTTASTTITLPDATKPTVTGFTIPATGTSLEVSISTLTATDNVAVTGYLLTEQPPLPSASASDWSSTKPASYIFSNIPDGIPTAKTLFAWTKDAAGNISFSVTATTTITLPDVTKPSVTGFTLPSTANTATVAIATLSATDNAAVTGYMLTESAAMPLATDVNWSATKPATYTFASIPDGIATVKSLFAWAKDAAGNVSASATASTTITLPDITKPIVTGFTIPLAGTSVTLSIPTFTATDNVAVTGYMLNETATAPLSTDANWSDTKPEMHTFSAVPDGIATAKSLYAWVKDAAGNVSLSATANTTITLADVTKPTVTGFTVPVTGTSLVAPVSTFNATDNVAVTGYLLTETATAPAASAGGWSATAPEIYTFTNIPDGIATVKSLYAWAKDAVGNVSTYSTASTTITLPDVTRPTVTSFTIPGTSPLVVTVTTFNTSDNVAVTGYCITATDSESACSWSPTTQTSYTFTTAGSKSLYAWAKDGSGNISLPVSANVTVSAKPGDSDGDGSVSIAEVQSAINMFLGLNEVQVCVDADNSGAVSISEVQKVINGFLGL